MPIILEVQKLLQLPQNILACSLFCQKDSRDGLDMRNVNKLFDTAAGIVFQIS